MNRVLVISASNLATDPRVRRHVFALRDHLRVTVAGFGDARIEHAPSISIGPTRAEPAGIRLLRRSMLIPRQFMSYYWSLPAVRTALRLLQGDEHSTILANDVAMLPLAARLADAWDARLVFDAHEHAWRQFEDRRLWRTFVGPYHHYLLQRYLPRVDAMTTVSAGIARAYEEEFGIACQVLTNAAPFTAMAPSRVDPDGIRAIHHGAANPSRRLESMIDAMHYVDRRFTLDLMLVPNMPSYLRWLKDRAAGLPNVHFREPVAFEEIVPTLNPYDIGLSFFPPSTFNLRHTLPNKFFEFIQARLAQVIGPSVEMAPLVHQHGLGVVTQDFESRTLADALNSLTEVRISTMKQRADESAHVLNAESNSKLLIDLVVGRSP